MCLGVKAKERMATGLHVLCKSLPREKFLGSGGKHAVAENQSVSMREGARPWRMPANRTSLKLTGLKGQWLCLLGHKWTRHQDYLGGKSLWNWL